MAEAPSTARCPRCHDTALVEGGPLSSTVCARCGGGLLPDAGLATLLEEINFTRAELLELADSYGGQRIPCPACRSKMSPLVLRGAPVDLCRGCGALWVDRGELELISKQRHSLPAPTLPAVRAPTSVAAPAQALVRVDERTLPRHVARAVLSATGAMGLVYVLVGVAPATSAFLSVSALAVATVLSRRQAFDVLPRARRMVRWTGFFAPDPKEGQGEVFSPDSCVVVRRLIVGGRPLSWVVIELVDAEGRVLSQLKGPTLPMTALSEAPRYARALGVSLRSDVDPGPDDALDTESEKSAHGPSFAAQESVHIAQDADTKVRRFTLRTDDRSLVGSVVADAAPKRFGGGLASLLDEQFVMSDATGTQVRLFSTSLLGVPGTILVGADGRAIGSVTVDRSVWGEVYTFAGAQARRRATVALRFGAHAGALSDVHGRVIGLVEAEPSRGNAPRNVALRMVPGRHTGEARWGLVALALHVSLVGAAGDH